MILRLLLAKPVVIGVLSVSALSLSAAGSLLQQDSLPTRTVINNKTIITPGPTTTITKHHTVAPGPTPAPGSVIRVPGGGTITVPASGQPVPGPTVTVKPAPEPGPTVTVTETPAPKPSPTCLHPPPGHCRHSPHPTISISVSASIGLP